MEYNRVKWASRRGMLELDLLLMPFVEGAYLHLTPAEQAAYVALLAEEDQDLFAWLLDYQRPPSDALAEAAALVVQFARSPEAHRHRS